MPRHYEAKRNDAKGRRQAVLYALLAGKSWSEAAEEAGVSERSVRRYLLEPAFAQELRERHDERLVELSRLSLAKAKGMLAALERIATGEGYSAGLQLRAIRTWLDYGLRFYEGVDLAERVAELERAAQAETGGEDTEG